MLAKFLDFRGMESTDKDIILETELLGDLKTSWTP